MSEESNHEGIRTREQLVLIYLDRFWRCLLFFFFLSGLGTLGDLWT